MRISALLSGQPRFFRLGYEQIKKNIIDVNPEIDFFIHAWINEEEAGSRYDCAVWNEPSVDGPQKGDIQAILDLYRPKHYTFEPHKTFIQPRDYSCYKGDQKQSIPQSMCWSLMEANRLKQIYELDNNFKYDWTMRLRFDSAYGKPIVLSEFDNQHLYAHNNCVTNKGATPLSISDQIAFGNSWDLDIYANIFPFLDMLWVREGAKYTQETLFGYHLRRNYVSMKQIDLQFGLIRGKDNIQWIV